ncbi:MAG: aconitate hydratase, partial [Candidatus Micrarchaeia archaeon]
MAKTVFQKIIDEHKESAQDDEIAIKIDHTLMQDATGTMTALEFQAMQTPRVKTQVSASFIDHNT